MVLAEKLRILAGSAKYDVSCASSGTKQLRNGVFGAPTQSGICHSWSEDGRCISLLKVLLTNNCIYDCTYCINRHSNDIPRASLTPEEIASLTSDFYRRNYIEGLFLSSAVVKNPDYTMELMLVTLTLLRNYYGFRGYIHTKVIPGASSQLIDSVGLLADRLSVNIELPSRKSLALLAPQKEVRNIISPMQKITTNISENYVERKTSKKAPLFAPAGQSTQLIIGATPDTDQQIMTVSSWLYKTMKLKRVYYSAYVPVNTDRTLPCLDQPPRMREHRLYQADWLLRLYGFGIEELFYGSNQYLNHTIDPKLFWALNNLHLFPLELNKAEFESLIRVPGIGIRSGQKIIAFRRQRKITVEDVKKLGIVWKRAQYFVTINYRSSHSLPLNSSKILKALSECKRDGQQLDLFESLNVDTSFHAKQSIYRIESSQKLLIQNNAEVF